MKCRILALAVSLASLLALTSGSASAWSPAPPTLTMFFGTASIPVGGHTTVTFKLGNPNTSYKLDNVAFADDLPAGLLIATPNNLGGSCVGVSGATITAVAGTRYVKLSGLLFDASASTCDLQVDVTGVAPGVQSTTTTAPTGYLFGVLTGLPATASINVIAAPSIAAVFIPATIAAGASAYVTFTITNPAANIVALTGVGFTTTLPAGLSVLGLAAPMCGGTLTLTPPGGVALSGASIATGAQCQFSLMFSGVPVGGYTIATSHVGSANGGSGNTGTAHLTVGAATATPSGSPGASEGASASPGETATPVVASSPSPAPNGQPAPADGGPNGMILVALGGIAALGLAGLLVALLIRRKRREK